ncbi:MULTISPECIES: hypothetical protein [unclassified Thioalkalivibrio]|uniref:hypothetical protein n=1 Tax=unclassified Thioalkalivibrio TaxID=2621013 RepID=UPI0012DFC173|nr:MULTISPECIES: hypothetical protein [unclassified Thioalkalivibrio]
MSELISGDTRRRIEVAQEPNKALQPTASPRLSLGVVHKKERYMGVLGNQPERSNYRITSEELGHFLEDAAALAKKHKVTVEAVISAKHALELERQNNIAVQGGDYTDEQAGGIGDILSRIASALEERA